MFKKVEKSSNTQVTSRKNRLRRLAVGYIRVSTLGQNKNGISKDVQRESIEKFAEHLGYTLIEIFEDTASGVGAKSLYKRKGLLSALDLASRESADMIVWDWDRLSRYSGFKEQVTKYLPEKGRVICAKSGTDLWEASKSAAFTHSEALAKRISLRTKEEMSKMRAQGVVFGNPEICTKVQPLGTATWSNTRRGLDKKIATVLRDLPNPMKITYAEIVAILNARGLSTLHGNEWDKSKVRQPVTRARQILREEGDMQQSANPNFGMF